MNDILAWYLHGITSEQLPDSLDALRKIAAESRFKPETLLNTDKWDFLIREGEKRAKPGFVQLGQLASTKRGIATGANDFFHLTAPRAIELKLSPEVLVPCIGRAMDVQGLEFSKSDWAALKQNGRRIFLVAFGKSLSAEERCYVAAGEESAIHQRFLLAGRKPWYGMESQQPAQIWAAVFGRQGLRFVHNRARVLTLTTFHCVYPINQSETAVAALTLCLNVPSIQAAARAQTRVYGGGLLKFEPRDLLEISVPDISQVGGPTLSALADEQARLVTELRNGTDYQNLEWSNAEQLIEAAAMEASRSPAKLPETHRHRTLPLPQQDGRKRHVGLVVSRDAQPQTREPRHKSQPANLNLWES